MNTSEQLKAEAIRKAWIAEIGEENYNSIIVPPFKHAEGYVKTHASNFQIRKNGDFTYAEIHGVVVFRPRSLYGIENNNGWTRIEPDGSNLPKEEGALWVVHVDLGLTEAVYFPSEDEIEDDTKNWFLNYCTHFQEITKPQTPIF